MSPGVVLGPLLPSQAAGATKGCPLTLGHLETGILRKRRINLLVLIISLGTRELGDCVMRTIPNSVSDLKKHSHLCPVATGDIPTPGHACQGHQGRARGLGAGLPHPTLLLLPEGPTAQNRCPVDGRVGARSSCSTVHMATRSTEESSAQGQATRY